MRRWWVVLLVLLTGKGLWAGNGNLDPALTPEERAAKLEALDSGVLDGSTVVIHRMAPPTQVRILQSVLFSEDFEAGMPTGWTIVDGNGDGATWEVGTTGDLSIWEPPNYGTQYAFYSDDDATGGAPAGAEELISPAVDVSWVPNLFLRYDLGFNIIDVVNETVAVYVSFFSEGAWGPWVELVAYQQDISTSDTFDLSGYLPADSVKFKVRYVDADGGWYWAVGVDNVTFYSMELFAAEDFEAGMPTGWTIVDGNGDGATWEVGTTGDLSIWEPPNYGTQYAFYSDDDATGGAPAGAEELISPAVDVSWVPNLFLRYDLGFNIIDVVNETVAVYVSFFSEGAWGPWVELVAYQQDISTSDTFDLSGYLPADSVKFKVRYVDADGGWYWAVGVDNITFFSVIVPPYLDYDVAVAAPPNPDLPDTLSANLIHPSIQVYNNGQPGVGPSVSFRVFYKVEYDGYIIYNAFHDVLNLAAGETLTVYFSPDLILPFAGDYTVTVTIQSATDPDLGNNAVSRTFTVPSTVVLSKQESARRNLSFAVTGPYPNPMRGQTKIFFQLPDQTPVQIALYDHSGRLVRVLASGTYAPGRYQVVWDGKDTEGHALPSGTYFYQVVAGERIVTGRILLLR